MEKLPKRGQILLDSFDLQIYQVIAENNVYTKFEENLSNIATTRVEIFM